MNEQNETAPAVGEVLVPTPGPCDAYEDGGWWHVARNESAEYVGIGNYNDIATMYFDMVQGEQKEVQEANARLFVASCNSYQKHFPDDPVTAAESDELGKTLAENQALRALVAELAEEMDRLLFLYKILSPSKNGMDKWEDMINKAKDVIE